MKMVMKLSQVLNMPKFSPEIAESITESLKEAGMDADTAEVLRHHAKEEVHTNESERTALAYVSTRNVDREGDIVIPRGVKLADFRKAPQVFWGHDYTAPPIGSDDFIRADEKGLLAKTRYSSTGRASEIWTLKVEGHLKTHSIGFIPSKITRNDDSGFLKTMDKLRKIWPELEKTADRVTAFIDECFLLEHSDVGVACNPNALTLAMAKGLTLSDIMIKDLGVELPVTDPVPEPEKKEPKIVLQSKTEIKLVALPIEIKLVAPADKVEKTVKEALDEVTGKV